jgi:putative FmdB family regulatory protein
MPIYEYQAQEENRSCPHCAAPFEVFQSLSEKRLAACPQCGAPLRKLISAPIVGKSGSGFDDRAKKAGFHKLQRLGKGEYEKKY